MKNIVDEREKSIRRTVLIVDDEEINREILGFMVGGEYDVIYAENGRVALEIINEKRNVLSLILLDLLMPEIDGYEVLKTLKRDPALKRIPVIVLTSEKNAEVESLKLGAVDFIPKPYDIPDVILARISRSIELAEDRYILNSTETDPLTGLYIKEFFFIHADRYKRFVSDGKTDAIVVNVNKLHLINELKGRACGDAVLVGIASKIKDLAKEAGGLACRFAGDCFYIYADSQSDETYSEWTDELAAAANAITHDLRLTVRIGIYRSDDENEIIEQIFDRATIACNSIRQHGVKFAVYDGKMREKEVYGERLLADFPNALSEKQFKVYYQPKYAVKGEKPKICSAEALVRWIHPELGFISPAAFIPLLENNGLISELDKYVWKTAAEFVGRTKRERGVAVPVSVNVSRVDLYISDLPELLAKTAEESGIESKELYLEITESAYSENSDRIIEVVGQLREKGFIIEMDDFGSGYSSLNTLADLPIDVLKLDMRFIRNICEREKDHMLVKLMIDAAKVMEIPTVAEGVETEEQLELLKADGCDIVQGYYFSKPLPEEAYVELLKREG